MEPRTFIIMDVKNNVPVTSGESGTIIEYETPQLANTAMRELASIEYGKLGFRRAWNTYGYIWQMDFTKDYYAVTPKDLLEQGE